MARRPPPATDTGARERILDAAEELFAATGFDATPTAKIAEAAGSPKGLLFYYFPKKIDILTTLFAERMPIAPLCDVDRVARRGDVVGSLRRLARSLDLGRHESVLLRTVLMREVDTHPEVRVHLRRLTDGLVQLTESVLEAYAHHRRDAPDRDLLRRARLSGELAVARWLLHGTTTGDEAVVADAVAMLTELEAGVDEGAR